MSDTKNGWPDKPGVPLNPGLPGAHWIKGYTEDAWMYDGDGGWWVPGYSHNLDAGTVAARYSYLGPCLTLDEAAALQARIAELQAALQDIANGRYSNVLLPTHPPQDPAVVRAHAALEGGKS